MKVVLKTVAFVLQLLGIVLLLLLAYVAYELLTWNADTQRNTEFVLGQAGLDRFQTYEVISYDHSGYSLNGDYDQRVCLEITTFSPSHLTRDHWEQGIPEDRLIQEVLRQASGYSDAATCLTGANPGLDPNVWYFVHRAQIINGDQIDGSEVTFFDPRTRRILYYGHQF
ncbi:MAG: hypothetical protein AAFQ22_09975 [Pseudomonadota bacterium]